MNLFKKSKGAAIIEAAIIVPSIAILIAAFLVLSIKIDNNIKNYCEYIEDDIEEFSNPVISAEVFLRNKFNSDNDEKE